MLSPATHIHSFADEEEEEEEGERNSNHSSITQSETNERERESFYWKTLHSIEAKRQPSISPECSMDVRWYIFHVEIISILIDDTFVNFADV